ncbi:carbohydrate ABC transporter permease [Cohnella zeiphila]|uniref:Carbohydrate ABC transporter permease n=1 Tax=Cohnella zeiphila TaxID=2761120 RepID=A0A7X0SR37_9BACL|nr:carbohydrate ABC transporter permease [Cohnella zeiphila]MBB6734509.1 carbohydrate ABC transporter permease [Cohnella zeiphila]
MNSHKSFHLFNYAFFIVLSLLCLLPIVHVLAESFSSNSAVTSGMVDLWPVDFTLDSYRYVLSKPELYRAFGISVERLAAGTLINLVLCVMIAYPLSKEVKSFRARTFFAWFFVFTMLFNGGLIPSYMVVRYTGLLDSIGALTLSNAVNVFFVVLMLNFFRGLPKELEEAAFVDGAGHWTTLWRIYVPLSTPSIATIALFSMVFHWNSWFDGLIFMNSPDHYPLASYLQTVVNVSLQQLMEQGDLNNLVEVSDRTARAAQILVTTAPILVAYPFLQRYFVKGIVLGSVKG